MFKVVVFIAFLAIAQGTNVERCRWNAGALPASTRIEGCANPPCSLPQLQNAVIHMNFIAPRRLDTNLRTLATAYLNVGNNVIPVPYNLGAAANTCNFFTNVRCPVAQNTNVNYTLRVMIEAFFPIGTTATIEFRIQDNQPMFCISVPIRIVGPRSVVIDDVAENVDEVPDQINELPMEA